MSIGGTKGGTGKSLVATLLAGRFRELGLDVYAADGDPQGSFVAACEASEGALPECSETFPRSFGKLAQEPGLWLLDLPSGAGDTLATALAVSDAVVIPLAPGATDLRALPLALTKVAAAQEARGGTPRTLLLLNKLDMREAAAKELLAQVGEFGWPVCPASLKDRAIYRRAGGRGLHALRRASGYHEAAREVAAVADAVLEFLGAKAEVAA